MIQCGHMAEQVIQCKSACKGYTTMETPYIILKKQPPFTQVFKLSGALVYMIDIL